MFPVVGERRGEAEDFLSSESGQPGEPRPVQAQQVALDHVLCLVDDEDPVVLVILPAYRVPRAGDGHTPTLREHRQLLLNLLLHNLRVDVDDDSVKLGLVLF